MTDRASPILLRGGTVWAGDPPRAGASWLRIEDGAVAGSGSAADEPAADGAEVVELDGRHVIPGITDCHTHVLFIALRPGVRDGSGFASREDAIAAVASAARSIPPGRWIVFLGVDHRRWHLPKRPTRDELDGVAPNHPVLLSDETIHEGVANSAALRASGVRWMPDRHDDVDRDRRGRPTGLVWEQAYGRVVVPALADLARGSEVDDVVDAVLDEMARLGVVRIHEGAVPPDLIPVLARARERTAMEISWSVTDRAGYYDPPLRLNELARLDFGDGPPWVKLFADGGHRCALSIPISAATTALPPILRHAIEVRDLSPLEIMTERRTKPRGAWICAEPELRYADDELTTLLLACEEAGIRPRIHALGDLAAVQVAQAGRRTGLAIPWSLEHAFMLRPGDAERIAEGARIVNLSPRFLPDYVDVMRAAGVERKLTLVPAGSLRRAGVRLAMSSDNPLEVIDPLVGLRLMASRILPDGEVFDPDEAIPPEEALRAATAGAVESIGLDVAGLLTPGARADLAILDGDPFAAGSRVTETWIGGRAIAAG